MSFSPSSFQGGAFAGGAFKGGAFANGGAGSGAPSGEPTPTLTLYLDIVAGNDTNDGLTPETAVQTFGQADTLAKASLVSGEWLKLVVTDMGEGGPGEINGAATTTYGYCLWLDAQEACSLTVLVDFLAEADQFYFTGTFDYLSFDAGSVFVENSWTMLVGGNATINALYIASAHGADGYTDEFEAWVSPTAGADSPKIRFNDTLSIETLYVYAGNGGAADLSKPGADGGDARDCYREAGVTITSSIFTPGTGGTGSPAGADGSTGSVIVV